MTHSRARADASAAIRAAAPEHEIINVYEVDSIAPGDVPILADQLPDASISEAGDGGPAVVAVMAEGRADTQAVMLTVYVVVRSHLELLLTQPGRGRGLAIVDKVEAALQELPGHGLPRLWVRTTVADIGVTARKQDSTARVWICRCTWPPAHPVPPVTEPQGGTMGAIRDHVADAITAALPLDATDATDLLRRGVSEADWRYAVISRLVPRCKIMLETKRESIGGAPDLTVIRHVEWATDDGREWSAPAATQRVIVRVAIWDRLEGLADEAVIRLAGQLHDTSVVFPGSFDARVVVDGEVVTRRLLGGDYRQPVMLRIGDPASWDDEAGLARAELMIEVSSMAPLRPATESVEVETTATARLKFPLPAVFLFEREDEVVDADVHGLHGTIVAESNDPDTATVTVNGPLVTVEGVRAGLAEIRLADDQAEGIRTMLVRVRRPT